MRPIARVRGAKATALNLESQLEAD